MEDTLTLRAILPPLLQLVRSLPFPPHRNPSHVRSRDMCTRAHPQLSCNMRPSAHVEAGQRSRVWMFCLPHMREE